MLKNKKILLAVCGSIAFYKAFEILSLLKKQGADVYVALSDGALEFCSVSGFEALSEHKILSSQTQNWQDGVNHISYSKMDLVLIAPASVNTINKLTAGICDNVFMQTLIAASHVPLVVAPAANNNMIEHFATQNSLEILKKNGALVVEPVLKTLACGDVGKGGLASPEVIVEAAIKRLSKPIFAGKKVVITGGATTEKIDDVRVITNFSSGKMAKALARAFYYAGAEVKLLASFEAENEPFESLKFSSSSELLELCKSECEDANLLVMCAAVSDFVPTKVDGKIKKEDVAESLNLSLKRNVDILQSLKEFKCKKIGFKLEISNESALKNARSMLDKKGLDAVCLNILGEKNGFASEQNEVNFITRGDETLLPLALKDEIAGRIVELAANL
ncbi:bifunctional phosphopantothenoylcysteine decarboxylase/phosphopantothenate--cysteine ligase CoaBC [Campylobacter concisus]|uniref:bifunctional phosphopantothenoylcysteine decarboxylase/phosphopantothenate--cysteine ligase CoaBC n=1 Tax=Campylobacter concisus TaxID=199 RepID=UPI000CD96086|nr:bifunctional phosphopantothenoylcysteine decarboxylase/phosphopantothenate--cysteine ligase CoaBC [Campylobacter concisus]QPH89021.1 bifunctional phosphopantothenoylcysteine decarboxylase/phosphopantothenate--cysteine ligase CoaBC [Campylobacter concisus]QPI03927.1 bifunctional phosphopantothenoylcysteine decarboxylase/phosphopantothenate--cysteine ligase CoaBC [Campylobacter concisus]